MLRLLRMDRAVDDPSELRQHILPFIQSLGSAVLIGGAIRDVARAGKDAFSSDFDFVVYGCDRKELLQGSTQDVACAIGSVGMLSTASV
ncbi:MAG TPA: hypothetical protein VN253_00360 [Kofleriaceae bacterium]|nr:hypothetical protein [Kofleriaceae bacterium]